MGRKKATLSAWAIIRSMFSRAVPILPGAAKLAILLILGGASFYGLARAEQHLLRKPQWQTHARFELLNVPSELRKTILTELGDWAYVPWSDSRLCEGAARRLAANGWVREVRRVGNTPAGQVYIDCVYRVPAALVQNREYFYLIDEYGIRLPGQYSYTPGLVLMQGVEKPPPEAGHVWAGEDVQAGLTLIKNLAHQPFGRQVGTVLVQNYAGRKNRRQSHLELLTQDRASRILWGSAPGLELEENTMDQKFHILAQNDRQFGRIDADQPMIDVSVFPDRFIIPTDVVVAEGGR